jgi:hypothetical protein
MPALCQLLLSVLWLSVSMTDFLSFMIVGETLNKYINKQKCNYSECFKNSTKKNKAWKISSGTVRI